MYGKADLSDKLPNTLPTAAFAVASSDIQAYQVYTNSKSDVDSYGIGLGINTKVFNGYNFGFNYTWSKF